MFSLLTHDPETTSQAQLDELQETLHRIRRKRALATAHRQQCQLRYDETLHRINQLRQESQTAVESYQSVAVQRQYLSHYLDLASRWNVLNDSFHIWHAGPWATINGVRLGSEAPRVPAGLLHSDATNQAVSGVDRNGINASAQHQAVAPRRYLLWSSSASVAPVPGAQPDEQVPNPPVENSSTPASKAGAGPFPAPAGQRKVPWSEVNAALGYTSFLLQLLKERGGWRFSHDLICTGSTSQIGIHRINAAIGSPPAMYNLYFCDVSSFSLFQRSALRNFNLALAALVECLAQAGGQLADKTIAMPHVISVSKNLLDELPETTTIGGLPIAYNEVTAVEFTRACKYLLTNMKWLVAYVVKHHVER